MTAIYSALHLLVDGVCAMAMFGSFLSRGKGYQYILIYNFCAFALQMPLGVLLDRAEERRGERSLPGRPDRAFLAAAAGALCTMAGAVIHPALLGLGNALFHVGAGVGCIRRDVRRKGMGRELGIFVAPGALGLYLGTFLARKGMWKGWYGLFGGGMLVLCAAAAYFLKKNREEAGAEESHESRDQYPEEKAGRGRRGLSAMAVCCLAVVILRSYIGMAVSFPWKTGYPAEILAVLALVFGKVAGGFAAAGCGRRKTMFLSLSLAAICYLFSDIMPLGLAAVFLFNMTMPVTLCWMAESMPRMPGLAFGFLTFALFIGFLPGYFGLLPRSGGNLAGCAGCVITMLLLTGGTGGRKQ